MSSDNGSDSLQSPHRGAPLSSNTPIATRSGRGFYVGQDEERQETEPANPTSRPPAPALPPSTPVQELFYITEPGAEMAGNMANGGGQGSAGDRTLKRPNGLQHQLPPAFVPGAGPRASAGRAAADITPPEMFVKIRTACAEAMPICFTLQEELQREDGLREHSQMTHFSRIRRVGDCLLDVRVTTDALEARVMHDLAAQGSMAAALAEQRDAAAAEVDRLRRHVQQLQAELAAAADAAAAASAAYHDGFVGRGGGPRAGGGGGFQQASSYSQVIGDLRRRPDQQDASSSYGSHRYGSTNSRNPSARLGNASLRGSSSRGGRGYYSGSRGGYVRFSNGDHSGYRSSSSVPYRHSQASGGYQQHHMASSGSSSSNHHHGGGGGVQLLTMHAHVATTSTTESGPESPARQRSRSIQAARRAAALDDLRSSAYGAGDGGSQQSSARRQQQQQREMPIIGPTPRQMAQAIERRQQMKEMTSSCEPLGPDPADTAGGTMQQGQGEPGEGAKTAGGDARPGYWEPSDGGSPIPLLKNALDFSRSTSDLKRRGGQGAGNAGAGPGGENVDFSSPSGDSSLHPSSSASNIRPRDPTPFRGQITPQLPAEAAAGARPPPSGGNGHGGALQLRGPPDSNTNHHGAANYPAPGPRSHGRDGGRQMTTYYANRSGNGRQRQYNGGGRPTPGTAMVAHHSSSSSSRGTGGGGGGDGGNHAEAPAIFTADDGLKLDKIGREWRRELDQVFTLFAGWVRKNCRTPNPAADSQIPLAFPRLWSYMLGVAYPCNLDHAAGHVRFLLSDPDIRCYFICRLLLQYVVMDVFSPEAWLGVTDQSTAQLQLVLGMRDALVREAADQAGGNDHNDNDGGGNDDDDDDDDVPPLDRLTRHQRHHLQAAQAECVARMLSHADWPRFRQVRVNACVNRFKDIAGPLMDDGADRAAASHDLYSIAVNAVETSARVLSSRLTFGFAFAGAGAKFGRAAHHAINSARDPRDLQAAQWRIMCAVTPAVTVRDDSGEGVELRAVAKAKVLVMA